MATMKKALAAVDLDVGTSRVLSAALALTAPETEGGRLIVLVVGEIPYTFPAAVPLPVPPAAPLDVAAIHKKVLASLEEISGHQPDAHFPAIEIRTAVGYPADEIVWLAASLDVDGIVIGSHGRRGLKRLLLGSVAEKVVRLAGCAVHVIREKNHDPDWKVPEIEPLCPDCATARGQSKGAVLWCARHSESHAHGHAYSYTAAGEHRPKAWGAMTGV